MIYAFSGKKQSGKSTASAYLHTKVDAERVNFKDRLVWELHEYFGTTLDALVTLYNKTHWDGMNPWTRERLIQEKPEPVRRLMQSIGKLRRAEDENYFVNYWKESATGQNVITDDVRFPNEARAIKDKGGIIIKVERTDLISTDTDESETSMDAIQPDYTIAVKTGQLDLLYKNIDFILEGHGYTDGSTPVKIRVKHE